MAGDGIGRLFRLTTFGESHGPAIGGVLEGTPPGIALSEDDIQPFLDERRPGSSSFVTQRKEADQVRLLSGVFEGKTTGTPIGMLIENTDQRSKDYGPIRDAFRPGHADYTWWAKYGHRDYRGGGRSSARETAVRVAGGAIARRVLNHLFSQGVTIRGCLVQMGDLRVTSDRRDWQETRRNPFFCPDPDLVPDLEALLVRTRKDQDSLGAVIEVQAEGVPAGLGEPVFDRLDADLAGAIMSINAVKGVEIGAGMRAAAMRGSDFGDSLERYGDGVRYTSNHAGGILGGISNGTVIQVRFAVKPTSSIARKRSMLNRFGETESLAVGGRHDPCVGIRAVPIGEAMMALVLTDHAMRHLAQSGGTVPQGRGPWSRVFDQKS